MFEYFNGFQSYLNRISKFDGDIQFTALKSVKDHIEIFNIMVSNILTVPYKELNWQSSVWKVYKSFFNVVD